MQSGTHHAGQQAKNYSWRWGLLIFLVSCAVVISRRPDAIFHPQFYAEDGAIQFAQAYNYGWLRVLFWPYNGLIHVFPRLVAALALLVPFRQAPLVGNLFAVAGLALPTPLLLSPASRGWGSTSFRAALAALYLALPNTQQIFRAAAYSEWPLTLCAFFLLVASPPRSKPAWVFSCAIVLLCSLTGPYCIFLLPIAAYLLWRVPKDPWLRLATAILLLGTAVQAIALLAGILCGAVWPYRSSRETALSSHRGYRDRRDCHNRPLCLGIAN
jgi:hypothetical protein